MKKVGIMTWYFGANYGAIAQSIATYSKLRELNTESYMIQYKPNNYLKTIIKSNIPPKKYIIPQFKNTIRGLIKCYRLSQNKYFKLTSKVKNSNDVNNLGLDGIVFGSDAIFNVKHPLWTPLYYGAGIKTSKISFSPSCEYLEPEFSLGSDCVDSLREMKAVSVRDVNTQLLVEKNAGFTPVITLDPTFLYDFKSYEKDLGIGKYILIYSFSDWSQYKAQITEYAKSMNLPIVVVGSYLKWADHSFASASFEEWVGSFVNAEVVITDSFHGTVFSLKNRKQIVLLSRSDKSSKIKSLLDQFGIVINAYTGESISQYLNANSIDYSLKENTITREIEKAANYLKNAVSEL